MTSSEAGSTAWNSCPKLEPSLPLKPAQRTWSSRSAPRRDQRICCDLAMRRLTRKLAVPSVSEVPTRRPARARGVIEIVLAGGYRLRVGEGVQAATLRLVLDILERR